MEKRKEKLSARKQCRFCLSEDESIRSLYERNRESSVPLSLKIMSCVSVEVFASDKMPRYICDRCRYFMEISYEFKQICRQADETILQFVQSGTPLEPITWPPALAKFFQVSKASQNVGVVKTIVEGGATVEVTSQDNSDSEDDEENVYNVKIDDGSVEGSSTCIKVVASKDKMDVTKEKPKQAGKDPEVKSSEMGAKRRPSGGVADGCWACDECECTYPLQQLLELHKMQKHRTRSVACDQCDAKFFSKYDLSTHRLRHSDEMPFECVACDRRFKRLVLLKRHEMRIHSDLPQQKCPSCPASFLSLEELDAHQKRHVHRQRPYSCSICKKTFEEKASLQRHKEVVHEGKPELSCEYCPERFSSVSKLARHVRSHAGERAYPCKYCDKSFIKSHHYTRHLKVKHSETLRSAAFCPSEQYRCEQCEDSFATQDELIYHSAIHATQNLTCPLCQEKFDNVDAVTSHIKSHVNGTEFMCDLCELVFTSREKLDSHMLVAHDDELRQGYGQDESSMETDWKTEDDDTMNVREEDDQMVVEIKKTDDFMLPNSQGEVEAEHEDKMDNTNSEESDAEAIYTELSTVDTLTIIKKEPHFSPIKTNIEVSLTPTPIKPAAPTPAPAPVATITPKPPAARFERGVDNQTASILRKAEEIKRKVVQKPPAEISNKKEKVVSKAESSNSVGASDKSLRLLEKELQDLKRTNRTEVPKTPAKPVESLRSSRRPQLHTSTPKLRVTEEKKAQAMMKSPALEKKVPERRAVKENKEPKEGKSNNTSLKEEKGNNTSAKEDKSNNTSVKEDKSDNTSVKEDKSNNTSVKEEKSNNTSVKDEKSNNTSVKEDKSKNTSVKENKEIKVTTNAKEEKDKDIKDTPKTIMKNGASDKSGAEDSIRRSTRPSKIKDYAKMIRDRSQLSDDESDDGDDEEYVDTERTPDNRLRNRRASVVKPTPAKPAVVKPTPARKRGRPRKDLNLEVPAKVKKDESVVDESKSEMMETESSTKVMEKSAGDETNNSLLETESNSKAKEKPAVDDTNHSVVAEESSNVDTIKPAAADPAQRSVMVSPTGQTLKKVPIKSLPPGVKPLPLPRPMSGPGELCEMQIGKKVVKVQKIVMTKAEVEAMAKKGLVEMKDGTMVLKQGIKIPKSDPVAIKSTLVGEAGVKESPSKKEKGTPSRCNFGEEA